MKLLSVKCRVCGGAGGEVEPVLDDGSGPWYPCGFCEGHGRIPIWRICAIYWSFRTFREEENKAKARRKKMLSRDTNIL